jgi:hypothetical protein
MAQIDNVKDILIENIKIRYPEKFTLVGDIILLKNFVLKGIDVCNIYTRTDIKYEEFDMLSFREFEVFIKPRLSYEEAVFYFNKRQINIYLYKDFAVTSKGDLQWALYILGLILHIESVLEELKKHLN